MSETVHRAWVQVTGIWIPLKILNLLTNALREVGVLGNHESFIDATSVVVKGGATPWASLTGQRCDNSCDCGSAWAKVVKRE